MAKYRHKSQQQSSLCACSSSIKSAIQTEAASLNTTHPAASAGGSLYERDLYRDKAVRETGISDICIKLQAKSIRY